MRETPTVSQDVADHRGHGQGRWAIRDRNVCEESDRELTVLKCHNFITPSINIIVCLLYDRHSSGFEDSRVDTRDKICHHGVYILMQKSKNQNKK